jgi:hypothetical protein
VECAIAETDRVQDDKECGEDQRIEEPRQQPLSGMGWHGSIRTGGLR